MGDLTLPFFLEVLLSFSLDFAAVGASFSLALPSRSKNTLTRTVYNRRVSPCLSPFPPGPYFLLPVLTIPPYPHPAVRPFSPLPLRNRIECFESKTRSV